MVDLLSGPKRDSVMISIYEKTSFKKQANKKRTEKFQLKALMDTDTVTSPACLWETFTAFV